MSFWKGKSGLLAFYFGFFYYYVCYCLFCTSFRAFFIPLVDAFASDDCAIPGGTTFESNGFTIISSPDIDLNASESNYLYPSASTYREILDEAFHEMKILLDNYTIDSIIFDTVLKYVPFHIEEPGEHWSFIYSGRCARSSSTAANNYSPGGCVVTQTFQSLIGEVSGTWLLHEYGH